MGGRGSGGRRVGAGRPRKSSDEHFVTGDAGRRGRVLAHPSSEFGPAPAPASVPVLDEAEAPNDLTTDERRVWLELAPFAMAAGTLTDATRAAFVTFCRWETLSRALAASVLEKGTNKHISAHKEALKGYYDFALRPTGKPMASALAAKPASPLDKFLQRGV